MQTSLLCVSITKLIDPSLCSWHIQEVSGLLRHGKATRHERHEKTRHPRKGAWRKRPLNIPETHTRTAFFLNSSKNWVPRPRSAPSMTDLRSCPQGPCLSSLQHSEHPAAIAVGGGLRLAPKSRCLPRKCRPQQTGESGRLPRAGGNLRQATKPRRKRPSPKRRRR